MSEPRYIANISSLGELSSTHDITSSTTFFHVSLYSSVIPGNERDELNPDRGIAESVEIKCTLMV